jgi:hypothetical protein
MDTEKILKTWMTLNAFVNTCSEKEAQELMKLEIKGSKRKNFIMRCYSRFNRMRAERERKELNAKLV